MVQEVVTRTDITSSSSTQWGWAGEGKSTGRVGCRHDFKETEASSRYSLLIQFTVFCSRATEQAETLSTLGKGSARGTEAAKRNI